VNWALSPKLQSLAIRPQTVGIEGLLVLHQGPGDDEQLCCELDAHLRPYSGFALPARQQIAVIGHNVVIETRGYECSLIEGIAEIGLAALRDDRYGAGASFPAPIGTEIKPGKPEQLAPIFESIRIADCGQDHRTDVRTKAGNTQEHLIVC